MLTIGEFSRICFVTKKTLRHYDEIGLLRPEHTAENGYRYYTVEQLRTMMLISRLKNYGLSLPEIAATLANPDEQLLAQRLQEKRTQMEVQITQARQIVAQMEQDIEKLQRRMDIMDQNITVRTAQLEPQNVYSIREKITIRHFPELMSRLYQELAQKKLQPEGPPMALYHDAEFSQEQSDIEVAVPVAGEKYASRTIPGGLHCCTTMVGPYRSESFTAAYAGLCKWIEDNGYRTAGVPFDRYVRGGEGVLPEEYVTEIYFPIAR